MKPIQSISAAFTSFTLEHWYKHQLLLHDRLHLQEPLEPWHICGMLNEVMKCVIYNSVCSMNSVLAVSCPSLHSVHGDWFRCMLQNCKSKILRPLKNE